MFFHALLTKLSTILSFAFESGGFDRDLNSDSQSNAMSVHPHLGFAIICSVI